MNSICFFGQYDTDYNLFRVITCGAEENGVNALQCQVNVSENILVANIKLLFRFFKIPKTFSCIVVLGSFYAVPLAWILGKIYRKKLVLKVVVSPYVTQVERRKTVKKGSIKARLMCWRERFIYKLPDFILGSTQELVNRWRDLFDIPEKKLLVLPVGSTKKDLIKYKNTNIKDKFNVVYWGHFLPQHGVEYILEATQLLRERKDIQFTFIGSGFLYDKVKEFCDRLQLENVRLTGFLPNDQFEQEIYNADVVLGFFGATKNHTSAVGIGNKPFEGLAMKKAVITEASPPVKRYFTHKKDMYLVKPGSPQEIADAVLRLYNNPKLKDDIADAGHTLFLEEFSEEKIGAKFIQLLESHL